MKKKEIKLKAIPGDVVYYLYVGTPSKGTVTAVESKLELSEFEAISESISYTIDKSYGIPDCDLFPKKEDLKKSIDKQFNDLE